MKRVFKSYLGLMGLLILFALGLNCRSTTSPAESNETFLTSVERASSMASDNGKHVFVHVGAEWCKPCRALHHEIYPQPKVKEALDGFVKLELDMDKLSEEHVALIRAMNVQSIPMVAIFSADLKTVVQEPVVAKANAEWVLNYLGKTTAPRP